MRIQRILLGHDFSAVAQRAFEEATLLAQTFGATIVGAHAIPEAPETTPMFGVLESRARELYEDLTRRAKDEGVELEPVLVRHGSPSEVIAEAARELQADLIVVGAGKKSTLERLLLGSSAERLVRDAPVPVWIVRPHHEAVALKRIVCACDGSSPSREAMAASIALARTFVAKLELVAVAETKERLGGAQTKLEDAAASFDLHGIEVERTAVAGDVATRLSELVGDHGADLVVLGSAGRTGLSRLIQGNTAEKLVRMAPCSILTVKPKG